MSERCFYKVEDSQSDLHKKCCEFLDMEKELTEKQKNTIEEKTLRCVLGGEPPVITTIETDSEMSQ